jgi:hypothetical protein
MLKRLEVVDILGYQPHLYVKNNICLRSSYGGVISLLIILCTTAATSYLGREMWEKKNPVVNRAIVATPFPDPLALDKAKWDFIFGLQYNNTLYIDNSIYIVKPRMYIFDGSSLKTYTYNIEPCTRSSFNDILYPLFSVYKYDGAWCISKEQNMTIQLNRLWGQKDFSYIEVSLYPCVNTTDNNNSCKPQEIINEKLQLATFSIYSSHYYIQTKDYVMPFIPAIYNDFFPVSYRTFTHSIIFFQHSEMISDQGWLLQSDSSIHRYTLDRAKMNFYTESEKGTQRFLRFQYQLSNLKEVNTRKYMKLQELCAQIGGLAKFLLICGMVLNHSISNFLMKEYLVNLFFDEPISNTEEINKSISIFKVSKLSRPSIQDGKAFSIANNGYMKCDLSLPSLSVERKKVEKQVKSYSVSVMTKEVSSKQRENKELSADVESKLENESQEPCCIPPSRLYLPKRAKLEFTVCEKIFYCCIFSRRNLKKSKLDNSYNLLRTSSILLYQ